MEVKLVCDCGQKFKFDVEPANGTMPFPVACPGCGADQTEAANVLLAEAAPAPPVAYAATPSAALHLSSTVPPPTPPVFPTRPSGTPMRALPSAAISTARPGEFNLGLGILGAFVGAVVGVGVMYGFFQWAGFRFPLMGVGIGVLTGFGAKLLYKGTDHTLGIASAIIALLAVVGSLYLMYGEFPMISIISVVVSVSVAYRISSG